MFYRWGGHVKQHHPPPNSSTPRPGQRDRVRPPREFIPPKNQARTKRFAPVVRLNLKSFFQQRPLRGGQLLQLVIADLGILQVQRRQRVNHRGGHHHERQLLNFELHQNGIG